MPDPPATQTVDRSPAALLLAMRDIADFHAASGTYQVLVDVEHDSPYLPPMISGERSTLFATGNVDARVDFSGLGPGAITMSDDRRSATDRKSTRLNSSHLVISYAVFCFKKN